MTCSSGNSRPGRLQRERRHAAAATFREATRYDLADVLALIADGAIAAARLDSPGDPRPDDYESAFRAIETDPNQSPLLAIVDGQIVGYLQLTFIPGLSRGGAWRGQLEAVRVASNWRGLGIGTGLVSHAIDRCRVRGCSLVQLTTDTRRHDARRFYETLGFEASHHGMKQVL